VITIEIVTIEARSAGGRGTPAHREPRLSHIAGRPGSIRPVREREGHDPRTRRRDP